MSSLGELGYIDSTVWYLEMFRPPSIAPLQPIDPAIEIVRVQEPSVRFYRYLYESVGGNWLWCSRRLLSDHELKDLISMPTVDIRVLWHGGVPIGYAEIDFRAVDDVELVYFGLMPEVIGRGHGPYLLDWTIRHAFASGATRFWVHTCDLDHPRARSVYEKCGFSHYDTESIQEKIILDMPIPTHAQDRRIQPLR